MQRAPRILCQGDCPTEVIPAAQEFRWEALEEELEIVQERQDRDAGVLNPSAQRVLAFAPPPPPGLLHPAKASGIWGIFALALVPLGAIVL